MADPGAVAAFYGRWARLYDLLARLTPGVGQLRSRAVDALALDGGDTVIDLGCGTGANLPYLRERVGPMGTVLGVDLTPGMLARAHRRVVREGWGNVGLVRGDASRAPTAGPVDAVIATFVVGMLDDPADAVEGWCDRLRPGGRITLLDAASSLDAGALNVPFRLFVAATAPPTARLRYDEPPAAVLDRRVEAARDVLAERTSITLDQTAGLGFLRLTAGRV